jgi:hypothetical protein
MKYSKTIIVALIAITTIIACSKPKTPIAFGFTPLPCVIIDSTINGDTSNNCRDSLSSSIETIAGPTTCAVNTTIQLQISSMGLNGCAQYPIFTQTSAGSTIFVSSKMAYHGCVCTQALMPISNTVNFTPQSVGTYLFSGINFNGNTVSHTIVVN